MLDAFLRLSTINVYITAYVTIQIYVNVCVYVCICFCVDVCACTSGAVKAAALNKARQDAKKYKEEAATLEQTVSEQKAALEALEPR